MWKNVEYSFGILQAKFQVISNPSCLWNREVIANVLITHLVHHNMIIENEFGNNLELGPKPCTS